MSVRRTTVFLAAAAGALVLALSGCGSDASDAPATSSNKDAAGPAAAPQQEGAAGAGGKADQVQDQGQSQQKAPDNLDTTDRSIIYSGTMTVEVKDVNAAAAQAIAFATGAGGFVGGDNRRIDGQSSTATITLRVPAEKFQATLDQLKSIGDEKSRQVSAQDVTDQVVDVESRITTAQASVERIRALLARAQTIGEITTLESELSRRESDLESLQSRKRKLAGLTSLSTITLVLQGPEAPVVSEEDTGILVGLRHGWDAFTASLRVALTIFGWLLPWLLFLGLPIWLVVWLTKRYRRTHPPALRAPVPVPAVAAPMYPHPHPAPPMPPAPRPTSPAPAPQPAPPAPAPAAAKPAPAPAADEPAPRPAPPVVPAPRDDAEPDPPRAH
ncbi:DUF4349 domain-containing protein [Dactylosporangium sp. NPDC000244]|uniref:DUF4349 domain-containing protein n=1 Tax=Dactylosporangium sp. NPDC000244 TaxID=3154365 RepID=UPI003330F5F1